MRYQNEFLTERLIERESIHKLTREVSILTDLVFKLLLKSGQPPNIGTKEITRLLGWSSTRFYYKKHELFDYGLKKGKQWEMPIKGLYEYLRK